MPIAQPAVQPLPITTPFVSTATIRLALAVRQVLAGLADGALITVQPAAKAAGAAGAVVIAGRFQLAPILVRTGRINAEGCDVPMVAGWRVTRLDLNHVAHVDEDAVLVADHSGFDEAMRSVIDGLHAPGC